ncbi:ATP-binding protein [Sporosarcina pasteurii]|uniref:Divergent AAA domain n=1 Tax=Sporosarcina pasteurii TaxID=1474 RepID=A0A380CBF5_SPOPA|nr:ATP-binding protein [Sporosarcina pasteurii]MDS9473114.1 ATP-binding protein [Sporosarcina pasteurii]SUJ17225.1 Divergent AAA domain [Sporosarcina pasteurii]
MKSKLEIEAIIQQLETHIADDFEAQDLDFKQWNDKSIEENIKKMIRYAVCMANGGGGSVVFGVADKVTGLSNVLLGVPFNVNVQALQQRIQDHTVPPILPLFDEILYVNGAIRILIMHIIPGNAYYTTLDGDSTVRQGKECLPFEYLK